MEILWCHEYSNRKPIVHRSERPCLPASYAITETSSGYCVLKCENTVSPPFQFLYWTELDWLMNPRGTEISSYRVFSYATSTDLTTTSVLYQWVSGPGWCVARSYTQWQLSRPVCRFFVNFWNHSPVVCLNQLGWILRDHGMDQDQLGFWIVVRPRSGGAQFHSLNYSSVIALKS